MKKPVYLLKKLSVAFLATTALAALPAAAADITVKMLNNGKDGQMVFEPSYVKAAVGDNIVFQSTEKGAHQSMSLLVPAGAKTWNGPMDADFKVKVEKEGVYLYSCLPHKAMGMVGVIQVGKPVNLADAKAAATKEQAGFAMNKTRFDTALAKVK